MLASLSTLERADPPPRRKSCTACIRSRRRCDRRQQACARCIRRGISCDYLLDTHVSQGLAPGATRDRHGFIKDTSQSFFGAGSEASETALHSGSSVETTTDPTLSLDMDVATSRVSCRCNSSCFPAECQATVLQSITSNVGYAVYEARLQSTALTPLTLPLYINPSFVTLSSRLQYSIRKLPEAPTSMVLEHHTPWCHPLLYEARMPRSMQDAYACCAMYMVKNQLNTATISQNVDTRVNDLLAMPLPSDDSLELLAYTQAFLLYQIIHLFGSNPSAVRSPTTEASAEALEVSARALMSHVALDVAEPCQVPVVLTSAPTTTISTISATDLAHSVLPRPEYLPLDPIGPTASFWRAWIFQESARRTILIAFVFLRAYRLLNPAAPPEALDTVGAPSCYCYSWTMSSHLWGARSPVDFATAWTEKKHLIVTKQDYVTALATATADDLDTFGKMLLATLIGTSATEAWLESRGGSL